jgi:hypothetical protein
MAQFLSVQFSSSERRDLGSEMMMTAFFILCFLRDAVLGCAPGPIAVTLLGASPDFLRDESGHK